MDNKEISNNPEKELIIDKSISNDKSKQISKKNTTQNKKNTTQNKKITPKNDKSNKSFDEISNEIFRDLVSKKDSLIKHFHLQGLLIPLLAYQLQTKLPQQHNYFRVTFLLLLSLTQQLLRHPLKQLPKFLLLM